MNGINRIAAATNDRNTKTEQENGPKPATQLPVFARLQALFPAVGSSTLPTGPISRCADVKSKVNGNASSTNGNGSASHAFRTLKLRIITWNMHDSLPKGDLEELLGKVPPWTQANATPAGQFPNLGTDAEHPYHLVVVACQECPSLSGIPMGLAAGFDRLLDPRDRDKDKDRERERERDKEKDKEKEREKEKPHDKPHSWHRHRDKEKDEEHDVPSGWTSMLEDWLVHGHGSFPRMTSSPTVADIGFPKPLSPRQPSKETRKGPYVLLAKERMMGIYMAIFVHRDVKGLVRGTSKSAVTAGLIGGRVGNKGGVGITVDLNGTRFLFLNAHLAAHEGKINHRLANFAKIKAELDVQDFLETEDPRMMAEDLTDKFDYTFLCGDLNFRLDITRLHADWLLSRKEYGQALAFDQLTRLMQNRQAFIGFSEAQINFPPTFKYDVQRSRRRRRKRLEERLHRLTAVEEQELEELKKEEAEEEAEGELDGGEVASVASSAWTSAHSKGTDLGQPDEDGDEFYASPSSPMIQADPRKLSITHKAKAKWLSIISPLSTSHHPGKIRKDSIMIKWPRRAWSADNSLDAKLAQMAASSDTVDQTKLRPQISIRSASTKSGQGEIREEEEKGVYDTSSKKRVPSWCDRILWKSTVEPEVEEMPPQLRPRNRMGQFFANALRPLSARVRRDSVMSSAPSSASESFIETSSPTEAEVIGDSAGTFSRSTLPRRRRSADIPSPSKLANGHHPDLGLRRTTSVSSLSDKLSAPERVRARRATAAATMPHSLASPTAGQSHAPATSRWRFFPSFLSLNSSSTDHTTSNNISQKGDVSCLSYNTLDDRGMTKLEGRSDHRPVVGTYVIYL